MRRLAIGHHQVAAADSAGHQKCPRLDAVGIDAVLGAVQLAHALHPDRRRAGALDIRAHGHQQRGQVDDLRLAGAVFHQRIAVGKNRRHQQIFRAGHRNLVENNVRAMQPLGACFQIAVLLHDGGAHRFQPLEVQIDGAVADGASAGLGHARQPAACDQRTQHQRRSAHGLDDLVFGSRIGEHAAADGGAMLCPAVAELYLGAHRSQQLPLGLDVADLGNILQHHFIFGENRGGHAGQRGILGSAYPNRSQQRITAANHKLVHESPGVLLAFVLYVL